MAFAVFSIAAVASQNSVSAQVNPKESAVKTSVLKSEDERFFHKGSCGSFWRYQNAQSPAR